MERIIEQNLELMLSDDEGGMLWIASTESIGGNAGAVKGYNCLATNFYFNPDNGLIAVFSNYPREKRKCDSQGTFRILVNFSAREDQSILFRIPEVRVPIGTFMDVSQVLQQSAERYNEIQGKNYPLGGSVRIIYGNN